MTTISFPGHAPAGLGVKPSLLRRLADALELWRKRSAGRAALTLMSAAELKDIGVTPGEAEWEAGKAPWQA
jgi:uncharacterized protein YjiS (DUF1127 family)